MKCKGKPMLAVATAVCIIAGTVAFAPTKAAAETFDANTGETCQTVFSTMYRTWVIKNDNTLLAWDREESAVKVLDDVKSVSDYAALKYDGSLWQLTDGKGELAPVKIMGDVKTQCSDGYVIKTDNSLWIWKNDTGKIEPVKIMVDVKSLSVTAPRFYSDIKSHFMAIKTDNSLWAWGNNGCGQLGDGTTKDRIEPVKIMENVANVSAGITHTMAVKTDGSLWAWGCNGDGQLGDGTIEDRTKPVKVMDNVASVLAAATFTLALKDDGSLWTWGNNFEGQLGDGTYTDRFKPTKIMDDVGSVSTLDSNVSVIKTDGSLWVWGRYSHFAISYWLPEGVTEITTPEKIMDDVTSVYHIADFIMIIKDDGILKLWGDTWHYYVGLNPSIRIIDGIQLPNKDRSVTIMLNGEKLDLTLPILNINGRTMYPLRECLEAMGAKVEWMAETKTAKGTLSGKTVEFMVGSGSYKVGGKQMQMDEGLTAFIKDGRTYIPIRYAVEALGFAVEWNEATQTITIK